MAKRYDLAYKEYVSRMVVDEGQAITVVARNLGISKSTVNLWVKEYKAKKGWVPKHQKERKQVASKAPIKTPGDYEKEISQQAKEIRRLERENQILKKAMHVFTENHE